MYMRFINKLLSLVSLKGKIVGSPCVYFVEFIKLIFGLREAYDIYCKSLLEAEKEATTIVLELGWNIYPTYYLLSSSSKILLYTL